MILLFGRPQRLSNAQVKAYVSSLIARTLVAIEAAKCVNDENRAGNEFALNVISWTPFCHTFHNCDMQMRFQCILSREKFTIII